MKKILLTFLFIFILLSFSHAEAQTKKPLSVRDKAKQTVFGSYAIVVGIEDYDSADINDLRFTEDDARDFADTLLAHGWSSDRVKLMTGKNARYEEILGTVNSITNMSSPPPDSSIVFFFSGHGGAIGQVGDNTNYLVPVDGSSDPRFITTRNLKLETIQDALLKSKFSRKFMFIDACRVDFSKGAKATNTGMVDNVLRTGIATFFSAEFGKPSIEDEKLKHGIFTYFLVKGLSGDADTEDNDGIIRVNELSGYVSKMMDDYNFKTGGDQRMVIRGEFDPRAQITLASGSDINKMITDFNDSLASSNFDKALEISSKMVSEFPTNAKSWYYRGTAYQSKRNIASAITDFTKAISLDNNHAEAYFKRGQCYMSQEKGDPAIVDFSSAINLKSNYALAWAYRGWIYWCNRYENKAWGDIQKAYSLDPNDPLIKQWYDIIKKRKGVSPSRD